MPSSTTVTNLKINKLKEAQFDAAVLSGIIDVNQLSIITDAGLSYNDLDDLPDPIQVSTVPTAASINEGQIIQYIGTTTSSYTNGYFYKCTSDGATPTPSYSWIRVDVQPQGDSLPSQTGNNGKFLTTNGTNAAWADIPTEIPSQAGNSGKFLKTNGTAVSWARGVENLSLQADGLTVFGTPSDTGSGTINIGPGTSSIYGGIAIGLNARATGNRGVAIAEATSAASTAVAIGYNAKATATDAVQLGAGTNANTGTLQFKSYQLLDTSGMIPEARLASTGSAVQGQALVLDSGLDAKWTTLKVSDLIDDSDFAAVIFRAWGAGE